MRDDPLTRRQLLAGGALLVVAAACSSRASDGLTAQAARARQPAPPVRADLYNCEGCEGTGERPAAGLPAFTQIAPEGEPGEPMGIEGTVYQSDGVTPAANVVIYVHHTDATGLYSRGTPQTEWSRRHGLLRGWVKTGADGRYGFQTIKPAPYPDMSMPAHVHLMVLEPGRRPYYLDDIVFEGEHGVTDAYRSGMENRGGNGIVSLGREGALLIAHRDIVLERHPA